VWFGKGLWVGFAGSLGFFNVVNKCYRSENNEGSRY
jgi:hypothetical protein